MNRLLTILLAGLLAAPTPMNAADIVAGNVTTALGPDFFFDAAVIGGGDNESTVFTRDITGYWTAGATVTLKGLGWASPATGTTATSATATFTDAGPDGTVGTGDDVVVGSVTDNLVFTGAAGEFVWDFDSDLVFTATGSGLRIRITANGTTKIRRKTTSTTATTQADVKLSLAGTAIGGTPPPVTTTATGGGNWDTITWNDGTANVSGDLPDHSIAQFGRYRTVTYRGIPAVETVAALNLGETADNTGQATLNINSGTLNVTGNLNAGRNESSNDSFLFANGGTLHVGGDAIFGRNTAACDGSLIVAGGTVAIDGDLAMGAFEQGGAMLRFQNPGSSPAVEVGGTLTLGRCALDLTFTNAYIHTPGQVITLVRYASRVGQFANFRDGDEFNCGRNRFRIAYDAGGNSITLTALPNWPSSPNRPNIIFLFSDDGGYADQHLQGSNKFPTPELDNLAAAGARFTDAYVTGGVCHPSRCGLLMGRYQQRFGTDNNLSGPTCNGMPVSQRTVPQRLQGLGYRTYGTGKWHLGETVEFHPNCRGFDRWYGAWAGNGSYYGNTDETTVFQNQMTPQFADENAGNYVTDRIGDATVGFIDEHLASHSDQPFYIYVSFTAIHAPMDTKTSDPRFARLQSEFGLDASDYLNSPIVFSGSNQATVDQNRYELAAMTLAMDENVGKILDKLDAEGLTNDTLVVYTNDNGGAGWVTGYGGNYSYNTPLRGYKGGTMTDGAIRVPCAAKWPGTIPAGQTITDPIISLDWGATFVNAANDAPAEARNGLDGIDLLPRLAEGTPLPADRVLCWRAGGTKGSAAARMGDWKILIPGTGSPTLYNLRSDIDENNNLAASQPAVLAELLARFNAWEARTLPPLYGTADTIEDTGLERQPIAGGMRLKSATASPVWVSASLRKPLSLAADFDFAFMIRASENGPYPANAKLLHGLGDSTTRADLIRFGIDFGSGKLMLSDGKAGTSASAPLPSLPTVFANATLRYRAATDSLTLSLGATSVTLPLTGSYGNLTTHAMGVAAMEGEITTLRPIAPGADGTEATSSLTPGGDALAISLEFAAEPPFEPRLERSADLNGFAPDTAALLESLGGGRYVSSSHPSGLPREFFRFRLNQP